MAGRGNLLPASVTSRRESPDRGFLGARSADMPLPRTVVVLIAMMSVSHARASDTAVTYGAQDLLTEEFDRLRLRKRDEIELQEIAAQDTPAVLARLKEMPK